MVERKHKPIYYTNKELKNKSGIYQIRNLINNKFYIGSAVNLIQRKTQHFSDLRCHKHGNPHLQRAFNKYGEQNFIFEVIEFCEPEKRIDIEQYWLDRYFGKEFFYNENSKADRCNPRYGKDNNKSTSVICLDTKEIFNSLSEASKKYNIDRRNIGNCCRGIHKHTHNTHWMYYEDYINSTEEHIIQLLRHIDKEKKIICLETKNIYKNLTDASSTLNINKGNIYNCCNHTRWTVSKDELHFLYLDEYNTLSKEEVEYVLMQKNNQKAIIKLDTKEVFYNKKDCIKQCNISARAIYNHCNKLVKNPNFMYFDEYIKIKLDTKA